MIRAKIIYQSKEDILGKHFQSDEWIYYTGKLIIYDRKTFPVILKLTRETCDSFIGELMEEYKEIKGKSVSEVFGKTAKWFFKQGIIFQN